jgi:O-antigen/teichoic acid export membrane protein
MSAHAKSVINNTLAQLFAKFIGAGLTFLTTAIIIRLSGADLFGDLTKSLALIAIGFTAIDFGLNATTVRLLSETKNKREVMGELISTRLLLSLVMVAIPSNQINLLAREPCHCVSRTLYLHQCLVSI